MRLQLRFLIALLIAFAVDGLTKTWAEKTLSLYTPVPLIGQFFRLTLGYNTGVAFSLFANGGVWPLILTGLIITILAVWMVRALRAGEIPPVAAFPIGMILGGAAANFADRLPDSQVTDFLDMGLGLSRWPTFNLADAFIVLGVSLLMLTISKQSREDALAGEGSLTIRSRK